MESSKGFRGLGGTRLEASRELVGVKRWMRQAARKHSKAKPPTDDTGKAAADALAQLLKGAVRHSG